MSKVIQLGNCMANTKRENPNQGRVYDKDGISPCLTSMTGGNLQPMIIENTDPKLVGGLGEKVSNGGTQYYNQDRVYDSNGVAVAVATSFQPNYLVEKKIVAMRGRNPDNPSDRTPGIATEQRLEPNSEGICNTLTTVQKDNLVLESKESIIYDDYNSNIPKNQDCIGTLTTNIGSSTMRNGIKIIEKEETVKIKQATSKGYIDCKVDGVADFSFPDSKSRRGRVQGGGDIYPTLMTGNSEIVKIEKNGFYEQALKVVEENEVKEGDVVDAFNQRVLTDGISPTITTRPEGKKTAILPIVEKYRIRKLTPRECFRLMGVKDEDSQKMLDVNSNTQCYKQAGNSIVVQVLMAIFAQLIK